MARSKQATATAVQPTTESAQPTPIQEAVPQAAETVRSAEGVQTSAEANLPRLPDAREMRSINLGPDKDSPRLRLLRNYRFNQMQIRSDEALPEPQREQLKAAGWTERPEEGNWTKQLPPRRSNNEDGAEQKPAWPIVVEAERLFHKVATAIRDDKGLPRLALEL